MFPSCGFLIGLGRFTVYLGSEILFTFHSFMF